MSWDLSNILSFIGIIASIANICVVIYIYKKWTFQKQREVIANDAGILIKEIESLGNDILDSCDKDSIDDLFIRQIDKQKKSINDSLGMIRAIDKNLVYEYYVKSVEDIINEFRKNPKLIDESVIHRFWMAESNLSSYLKKLRLFA